MNSRKFTYLLEAKQDDKSDSGFGTRSWGQELESMHSQRTDITYNARILVSHKDE